MNALVINQEEVEELLPMNECIDVMEKAFIALARGDIEQPLRTIFRPGRVKGVMAMMPVFRQGEEPMFGLKAICVFPGNAAIGKDAHRPSGIGEDSLHHRKPARRIVVTRRNGDLDCVEPAPSTGQPLQHRMRQGRR